MREFWLSSQWVRSSSSVSEREGRHTVGISRRCIEVFWCGWNTRFLEQNLPCWHKYIFTNTLDTCTRLTRFLIEELLNWKSEMSRYLGTGLALALPAFLVFKQFPVWMEIYSPHGKQFWSLWSNQSIACRFSFAYLCRILKASKVGYRFALLPAIIMIMPMTALVLMVQQYGVSSLLGGTALAMFVLGFFLMFMAWRVLTKKDSIPALSKTA